MFEYSILTFNLGWVGLGPPAEDLRTILCQARRV